MIWVCFVLIFIFDIYFLVYLKHCNDKLRQEVKATREWCNKLINTISDQEKDKQITE